MLSIIAFSVLLLVLTAMVNGWISYRKESLRQEQQLQAVLAAYSGGLSKAVWELDGEAARVQLSGLRNFPSVLSAQVQGPQLDESYVKPQAEQNQDSQSLSYDLLAPLDHHVIGNWRIRMDREHLRQAVWHEMLSFVWIAALELAILAALIHWWMQRTVSAPVLALSRHVHGLSAQTLAQAAPLPLHGQPNELHQLAEGVTRMQLELRNQLAYRDAATDELESQRDQLNKLLAQQGRQLDGVLQSMADGAGVIDDQASIVFANPAWAELMAAAGPEQLINRTQAQWLLAPPWPTMLQRLQQDGVLASQELTLRRADGQDVQAEASFSVLDRLANGRPCRIQIVLRDLSKRLEAERTLIAAREAALAATQAKSEFLANMSHEIRTPMNAILGMTDLALRTPLTPKQQDYLHKTRMASRSLLAIINDILDFSKIEAGKLKLEQEAFSLDQVLAEVSAVIALQAQHKGVEFLLDTATDVPKALVGDALRLTQVLINLCNNAVKFTESGEIVVTIFRASAAADRVTLHFSVRDTGIGMAAEQVARLFQPFAQADASTTRKFGGTGLGLAISQQLVQMMAGRIAVASQPGLGSDFYFRAEFGLGVEPQPSADAVKLMPKLNGLRALVVDDSPRAGLVLRALLLQFGIDAEVVTGPVSAWSELTRAAATQPYKLVCIDSTLADTDGIELAARIQQAKLAGSPKILLLVPFGDDEVPVRAHDRGLEDCLCKPVSAASLFDALVALYEPRTLSASTPRTALAAPGERAPAQLPLLQGLRVLLVEDNPLNRQVAVELLQTQNVQTTIACSGMEALERLNQESVDAVLMDVQMPGMDGYETTRRIRQLPQCAHLPIIAMTAHAMSKDRELCLAAGMSDYLTKPIEPAELFTTLSACIAAQRAVTHFSAATDLPLPEPSAAHTTSGLPAQLPGIVIADGLRYAAGNPDLYLRLLRMFNSARAQAGAEVRSAIQRDAWAEAAAQLHVLKADAATIGASELAETARAVEQRVQARELADLQPRLTLLEQQLHTVIDGLEEAFNQSAPREFKSQSS